MRYVATAILVLAFSVGALAQHRGGGAGMQPQMAPPAVTSNSGWGNVVFPGTGGPPPMFNPNPGIRAFPAQRGFHSRGFMGPVSLPWAYPIYVGAYDNPYNYQQPPPVNVVVPPQAAVQPAAPIIINQYFGSETAKPVVHEYGPNGEEIPPQGPGGLRSYQAPSNAPAESSDSDQVLFYIVLKDSSIYTAAAYWVEGETLHYITPRGKHNQVSVALVDRDLSTKLNRGNKVDFHLPSGK